MISVARFFAIRQADSDILRIVYDAYTNTDIQIKIKLFGFNLMNITVVQGFGMATDNFSDPYVLEDSDQEGGKE